MDEVKQKIKQNNLRNEDLVLDPSEVRELYTDNYYNRSLSLLEGWTGYKTKLLKITPDGILKVASTGSGLDEYTTENGTGSDSYVSGSTYLYSDLYSRWDILVESNDAVISFRNNVDTDWLGDIVLPVGYHSIDFSSLGIRIKNRTSGSNTDYHITAYR